MTTWTTSWQEQGSGGFNLDAKDGRLIVSECRRCFPSTIRVPLPYTLSAPQLRRQGSLADCNCDRDCGCHLVLRLSVPLRSADPCSPACRPSPLTAGVRADER